MLEIDYYVVNYGSFQDCCSCYRHNFTGTGDRLSARRADY